MSRLEEVDYYIGLDCGTDSVGYAVTDTNYKILKFNGKAMWGSHIFDTAVTAAERRGFRCSRRRTERRRQRLNWLQEIFAEEIYKVDPTFFIRLNDSKYLEEDKETEGTNILFNDEKFKDKDFFKKYPTIYHLRQALMDGGVTDPRLLYLGVSHIIKHRGHFLTPGDNITSILDISPFLENIQDALMDIFELPSVSYEADKIKEALKTKTNYARKEMLEHALDIPDKKIKTSVIKIVLGQKVQPKALFDNESYEELPTIEFRKMSFEEADLPMLEEGLDDDEYKLIIYLKALFDWAILVSVIPLQEGKDPSISSAKVMQYEVNKIHLRALKDAIKKYCPNEYDKFFHSKENGTFSTYIGKNHDSRKSKEFNVKRSSTDEFYKTIKNLLQNASDDKDVAYILNAIDNNEFLPLLSSYRNSVIPYQLNKLELEKILNASEKAFPFLLQKDKDGFSNREKIISLLTFRIPYFVGPLGTNKEHTQEPLPWMKRKEKGRITPWNFNAKVDLEESAERFIARMTNKCTYLREEDVLPKDSIAYSRFMVLNELNNLRIKGERIPVEQKQAIFESLYKTQKKVTKKKVITFAENNGWHKKNEVKPDDITGIDQDIKSSMSSFIDFKEFIDSKKLSVIDVDRIIKWITVFSEGGDMLKSKIQREYGSVLSKADIAKICRLKYAGWGRFSYKFLYGLQAYVPELHENKSIVGAMWETQNNLMELLSSEYSFRKLIDEPEHIEKLDHSVVEELYASPAVKKQIWQTLQIVDELERIMKHPPKKVFVEVTRGGDKDKNPTTSRKADLERKLKDAVKSKSDFGVDLRNLMDELSKKEESDISRQDKLYLYFSQCGKCMYTGQDIVLDDLYTTNKYDVDHIYPYSRSNDDSLQNKVLVVKESNARKSNDYPIDDSIRERLSSFWKALADKEFIPKEKYQRLVRCTPLTDDDTKGFIQRQIVETSQTAKATIEILKSYFGSDTKLVYSKARNVSAFRQQFDLVKCRSLNNLHHAKDAYLNIVVGNILDVKYTSNFFMGHDCSGYYNISKPFDYAVKNAWDIERVPVKDEKGHTQRDKKNREVYRIEGKDIETVRATMRKNNIQYTVQPTLVSGQLFKLQIVPKGSKKGALPTKPSDPRLKAKLTEDKPYSEAYDAWTSKYGGYNSLTTSFFSLVKHEEKGKEYVSFIPVSIIDAENCKTDDALCKYCEKELGLKNVFVIRHTIMKNSFMAINGFPVCITGRSNGGVRLLFNSTTPLILSEQSEKTLKHIESFLKKKKTDKAISVDPEHDSINEENTEALFCELIKKHSALIYSGRPGRQNNVFSEEGLASFKTLSLDDRCTIVNECMSYFGMGNGLANLFLVGGSETAGKITMGAKYNEGEASIILIDKSITGLFETRTKVM